MNPTPTPMEKLFGITQEDKAMVLQRYFGQGGQMLIKDFPPKQKRKVVILQRIAGDFETGREYREGEVNAIIKRYYEDFESVRRALVQYNFMDRTKDGSQYWLTGSA